MDCSEKPQESPFIIYGHECASNKIEALNPEHLADILLEYRTYLALEDVTDFLPVAHLAFLGKPIVLGDYLLLTSNEIIKYDFEKDKPLPVHTCSLGFWLEEQAMNRASEKSGFLSTFNQDELFTEI